MTEKELIKAWEICLDSDIACSRCPFDGIDGCIGMLEKMAFDLLISYRANNARLMGLVDSAPSEGVSEHADLISELKEQQESYSAKKRKYKNYIPLSQYWSGREAEAKRIIEILKRKDDGK